MTESVETAAEEKEGDFCGKVPGEGGRVKERRVHVDLNQPCHGVAPQLVNVRGRAGKFGSRFRANTGNPDLSHPFTEEFGTPL